MNAVFVTVRSDSTRLPYKCFLPLNGKPVLQHVLDRAKLVGADTVIVCTTDRQCDNYLAAFCSELGFDVFRGQLDTVVDRWRNACIHFGIDRFVNFDADDPLADYELMRKSLSMTGKVIMDQSLSVGTFTTAMDFDDFENGISSPKTITTDSIISGENRFRLTLDYKEDYEFFKTVFHLLDIYQNKISTNEIKKFLSANDCIVKINSFRDLDWRNNQRVQTISK